SGVVGIDTPAKRRNPDWKRDELILALDLYFRIDVTLAGPSDERVVALSDLLNRLPIHSAKPDVDVFRNPNGVYMKLMNLRSIDPSYSGRGLSHGSELDGVICTEFAADKARLGRIANAIRTTFSTEGERI